MGSKGCLLISVTYNNKGQVEGVKYDKLVAVLINAIQDEQSQKERKDQYIRSQQWEIYELENRIGKIEGKLE